MGKEGGGQALKGNVTLSRETLRRLLTCALRALLAALLAGAQIFGGYAPFAVGAVAAAGPSWEGLGALVGAGTGALVLLDFPHALRTMACSVLLFTANNAFCELKAYQKKWFLPALTAGLMLAVEAIYVVRSGSAAEAAYCATAIAVAALFAYCCRVALGLADARAYGERAACRAHPVEALVLLIGVLTAFSSAQFQNSFAPGRIFSVLAVLYLAFDRDAASALTAAVSIGLAMDLAAPETAFLHTASYGFGALTAGALHRDSRVRAAGVFALSVALFALPLDVERGVALLYEGLAGTLLFLLLPSRVLRAARERGAAERDGNDRGEDASRRALREASGALRELYDSVSHTKAPPEENPAVVFDRAAETVCRDCSLRESCWEREYGRTYNALNDATAALLRNAQGREEDFPSYFVDRCVRFPAFLSAVNTELRTFLLRRQYRARLEGSYARSATQYAQLSELLAQAAERPAAAESGAAAPALAYEIGVTLRPKDGEHVSGDCMSTFETDAGKLCLLLADGMGSGENARRESALAVRLIERFLRAGVDAPPALQTLNSAMGLRAERAEGFTTVDLLTLSLKSGEGELYKYGAAPSYIKRGKRVRRVSCSCLPAGLAEDVLPPETTHVRLESGSFFVMVTDGIADGTDDQWLQSLLAGWEGENPQLLVSAILADSYDHKGTSDDAGVLVLYLSEGNAPTAREV